MIDASFPFVLTGIACFALGAIFASFGGVIAGRLYTGQSWASGRSRCDSCGAVLGAASLVPILSRFLSNGRCAACGVRVSGLYALYELVLGLLFLAAYLRFGLTALLPVALATLFMLYVLVLYDLRHTIVPPLFSAILTVFALAFAALVAPSLHAFAIALIVASAIGIAFLALHSLSGGRAMGLGDAPVAFALSLIAGPLAFAGLMFSFWIGAVVGIAILVATPRGHRMGIEVPFVPFLAAGYLLAIFTQWNPFLF